MLLCTAQVRQLVVEVEEMIGVAGRHQRRVDGLDGLVVRGWVAPAEDLREVPHARERREGLVSERQVMPDLTIQV